jgi:hypothetical protein
VTTPELNEVVEQIAAILDESEMHARAEWMRERASTISRSDPTSEENVRSRAELCSVVPGMGGLLDTWPRPKAGSGRDEVELHERLVGLAERLLLLAGI